MQVSDITPELVFVEKGDYFGNTRLWGRHILYNTHELYLGPKKSSKAPDAQVFIQSSPKVSSVENVIPN